MGSKRDYPSKDTLQRQDIINKQTNMGGARLAVSDGRGEDKETNGGARKKVKGGKGGGLIQERQKIQREEERQRMGRKVIARKAQEEQEGNRVGRKGKEI